MKKRFNTDVFIACIVLCLTGCGSSTQVSSIINDSESAEIESISDDTNPVEEIIDDSSTVIEEKESESETEETGSSIQNESESQDIIVSDAAKAYADYIAANEETFNLSFGAVGLIHLDDDEIPELAFSIDTSHPSGVCFYSYDGNNVIDLGAYGSLGSALYEYKKGTIYGYYSGMGSTFDHVSIVNEGKLINEYRVVITDIGAADPSSVEGGYRFAITDAEFNDTEISQEEYEKIINPFLIENRDYTVLAHDYLKSLHEIDNIEEALLESLDMEANYPKASEINADNEYFSTRVTSED